MSSNRWYFTDSTCTSACETYFLRRGRAEDRPRPQNTIDHSPQLVRTNYGQWVARFLFFHVPIYDVTIVSIFTRSTDTKAGIWGHLAL
jgi:hypothetical protein